MPSPFPGMDPYLEDPAFWRDFHGQLIYGIREQLLDRLPADYDAAVDEQVRLVEVHPGEDETTRIDQDVLPDVAVSRVTSGSRTASAGGGAITLPPVMIPVPIEGEVRDRWVEIRHKLEDELVTVIEVLSPTNKTGDDRAKRAAVLRQRVNLVELDLLLGGHRVERSERLPVDDYYAVVARAHRRGEREVYAWNVRRTLPTIAVPLKPSDPDVALDLAASFAITYERGRYARRLRYSAPPAAPLNEADRVWARDLVASVAR